MGTDVRCKHPIEERLEAWVEMRRKQKREKVCRVIYIDDGFLDYPLGCVSTAESAVWQLQCTVHF